MKTCSQCSSVFPDDYHYCLTDGTVLHDSEGEQETVLNQKLWNPSPGGIFTAEAASVTAICAACGLENQAGSKFCKKCGAPFANVSPVHGTLPAPTVAAFEVNLNPPSNQIPGKGDTIAFPLPFPGVPQTEQRPANPNRNIIFAVSTVGLIVAAIIAVTFLAGKGKSDNSNQSQNKANASPSATAAAVSLPKTFERNYQGTIGAQNFSMVLKRDGGELSGTASTRKTDYLYGTIGDDGEFKLEGKEDDVRSTGIYKGRIHPDGSITGTWTTLGGTKSTPFNLTER